MKNMTINSSKAILEEAMVSTPKGLTETIPIKIRTNLPLKKPSAITLLNQNFQLLDVKQKTADSRLGADK